MTDRAGGQKHDLILVVDDDEDIAQFIAMTLRFDGFDVLTTHDGHDALDKITQHRPDLVLLDVSMPRLDGVEVTRHIRADPLTVTLPVIMLTAKGLSADRVVGLTAGADDYIIKPFDALELSARVRSTLRRNREMREVSPLTGLPGNNRILREIAEWVHRDADFAVCYYDLDRFKAVNDAYGFVRGDEFITLLARSLYQGVIAASPPPVFLGHIGGDDFVVLCHPDQVTPISGRTIEEFENKVRSLYDPSDAARGYLDMTDRLGRQQRVGFVTVSVGVALSTNRRFTDPREAVAVATEMKVVAKGRTGSYVAVDRRRSAAEDRGDRIRVHGVVRGALPEAEPADAPDPAGQGGDESGPPPQDQPYPEPAYPDRRYADQIYQTKVYQDPAYLDPAYQDQVYQDRVYQVPAEHSGHDGVRQYSDRG